MAQHNEIGKFGEDLATNLLVQKGYKILERNWKIGRLEVDIIAANAEAVAFVEVKTRTSHFGGKEPEEYINSDKKWNVSHAAGAYVKINHIEKDIRFDTIAVVLDPNTQDVVELRHTENAFYPPMRCINSHSYRPENRWHSKAGWKRKRNRL